MAKGKHPVPFRTRKLSSSAPMVLRGGPRGRVGRRRTSFFEGRPQCAGGGPRRVLGGRGCRASARGRAGSAARSDQERLRAVTGKSAGSVVVELLYGRGETWTDPRSAEMSGSHRPGDRWRRRERRPARSTRGGKWHSRWWPSGQSRPRKFGAGKFGAGKACYRASQGRQAARQGRQAARRGPACGERAGPRAGCRRWPASRRHREQRRGPVWFRGPCFRG